jgi:hypothetical protein
MKLSEYIDVLKTRLQELGVDPEVCMTQGGYYAEGVFADMYDSPVLRDIELGREIKWKDGQSYYTPSQVETFLVLGHSYQSY